MKRTTLFLISIFLVLGVMLSACGAAEPTEAPVVEPSKEPSAVQEPPLESTVALQPTEAPQVVEIEEPKKGGTFVLGWIASPDNFLSDVTSTNTIHIFTDLMYPALLAYDAANNMAIQTTELADSFTFVDDKVLTFHLREAYWSDGLPITSTDVKFTIDNFTKPLSPFGSQFLSKLESVETPDEKTVVITLSEPFPALPYFWHWHYCVIMPEHVWKDYVDKFQENPEYTKPTVAGGAWMLEEFVSGSHASYLPNPYYWKENQPYLDRLIIRVIPDESSMVSALETGEIDMIIPQALSYDEAARLSKDDRFTVTALGKEIRSTIYYMFFNLNAEFVNDVNVRRALIQAIDQSKLIDDIFTNFGKPLDTLMPEGPMWDRYLITPKYTYPYDVETAKKLLDDAGYAAGSDGMRGITLDYVATNTTKNIKLGEELKSFWKEVGVELMVITLEDAAWKERVFTNYDFSCTTIDAGVASDFSIEGRWYKSSRIGEVMGNAWQLNNPRVDDIFATVAAAKEETKLDLYAELQEIVAETALGIFLQNRAPHVFNNEYGGLPARPDAQFTSWDFVYWKNGEPIK